MISPAQALTLLCLAVLVAAALAYTAGHARRTRRTLRAEMPILPTPSTLDADRVHRVYRNALMVTIAAYEHRPITREQWVHMGGSEREWTNAVKFARQAGVIRGPTHMPLWETLDDAKFALRRYQRRLRELAQEGNYIPPW